MSQASSHSSSSDPIELNNLDLEAKTPTNVLEIELERAITNHADTKQLEELTKVLSSKHADLNHDLKINPENFNLAKTLAVLVQRFDEEGFAPKYAGISFKGLTSSGIDQGFNYWPSMTELAYGIANLPKTMFRKPPQRKVIKDIYGVVKPGEILLVLGRPGAGCTSLLKTLAGEIDQFTNVEGDLRYDGASMEEMQNNFRNEVIYNPECK